MTSARFASLMRRVGVVGDGLTGLVASLAAGTSGSEVVMFGRSEPLGGLASPIDPQAEWLFDRIPLFWKKKGHLARLLRRIKVPMPTRIVPLSMMAIVRDDQRKTLPSKTGIFRRPTGPLSDGWVAMLQAARKGDMSEIRGPIKDASILLSLLWDFNPEPNPEAIIHFVLKGQPEIAIDGWIGVSGRLITACLQTDVSFQSDGAVTGLRRASNGDVDGIKRKGRVLPVDAVIHASSRNKSPLFGRYLGLTGQYLRPHAVLWDADREVLLVDLASFAPERVPSEHRGSATLLHCIALGDTESALERIESTLDSQCSGWRSAIVEDFTLDRLRLPVIPDEEYKKGVYYAHLDNAFEIGQRASQS